MNADQWITCQGCLYGRHVKDNMNVNERTACINIPRDENFGIILVVPPNVLNQDAIGPNENADPHQTPTIAIIVDLLDSTILTAPIE